MTTAYQHVPLSALSIDNANVRRTGRGAEPQFAASIRAKGVIEPLTVRTNGKGYTITNGGKRFEALLFLRDKGEAAAGIPVTGDYPVPIIVRQESDADARETSLITNVVRAAMHPVDEHRAFAALYQEARSAKVPHDDAVALIARRYAITAKRVEQRLALGALDPKILDAWAAGGIATETAQAFTLCGDKKNQVRIFDKLTKDGNGAAAWRVKDALKIGGRDNAGKLVEFIGADAYEARGGKVTRDLFGTDHVVSNEKLARAMADEKLEAIAKQLVADGWAWAETGAVANEYSYGSIQPVGKPTADEKKRLAELQAVINAAEDADKTTPEQEKAADAACEEIERIEVAIEARAFTPAQKAKAGCFVRLDYQGALEIVYGRVKPAEKRKVEAQERAAKKPKGKDGTPKATVSNALKQRLRTQMLKSTKAALVAVKYGDGLGLMLARIVASQINTDRTWNSVPHEIERSLADIRNGITAKVMNEAARAAFDAKDYFASVPKSLCLAAAAEAVNADEARKIAGKPKAEIAKWCVANVPRTGWLPPVLRTANYDGPAGKAKVVAKKAAVKKSKTKRGK